MYLITQLLIRHTKCFLSYFNWRAYLGSSEDTSRADGGRLILGRIYGVAMAVVC